MPWNKIENSFFSMVYSVYYKRLTLSWFWKGQVNRFKFTFAFERTDLIDDSQYKTERERYQKEQYAGYIPSQAEQRPHHTGIHYNYTDKQLAKLPDRERQDEIDRRKAITGRG